MYPEKEGHLQNHPKNYVQRRVPVSQIRRFSEMQLSVLSRVETFLNPIFKEDPKDINHLRQPLCSVDINIF